jgi:thiol-disulfide isomerase/thioredoxin
MSKNLPVTVIKIIISVLFLLSGILKLLPVWQFEKQLFDLGLGDFCQASYLSRFIISVEIAIGILILQKHYLKKIIIPFTICLLILFNIHLSIQMYQFGPMNGNCGCFGQIIPMTPLEAFIKNIITILLLIYLYLKAREAENNRISILLISFLSVLTLILLLFPLCECCKKTSRNKKVETIHSVPKDSALVPNDSQNTTKVAIDTQKFVKVPIDSTKTIKTPIDPTIKRTTGPAATKSKFSQYSFDGKSADKGKKIVCMFAPGCDHCRETAAEICKYKEELPEVYILFMDEEPEKISDFFKEAGCTYPYEIIGISEFWEKLGSGGSTPGVFYLWNGNIIKSYEGNANNKFNGPDLLNTMSKPGK